jgi:hypothetical protein
MFVVRDILAILTGKKSWNRISFLLPNPGVLVFLANSKGLEQGSSRSFKLMFCACLFDFFGKKGGIQALFQALRKLYGKGWEKCYRILRAAKGIFVRS